MRALAQAVTQTGKVDRTRNSRELAILDGSYKTLLGDEGLAFAPDHTIKYDNNIALKVDGGKFVVDNTLRSGARAEMRVVARLRGAGRAAGRVRLGRRSPATRAPTSRPRTTGRPTRARSRARSSRTTGRTPTTTAHQLRAARGDRDVPAGAARERERGARRQQRHARGRRAGQPVRRRARSARTTSARRRSPRARSSSARRDRRRGHGDGRRRDGQVPGDVRGPRRSVADPRHLQRLQPRVSRRAAGRATSSRSRTPTPPTTSTTRTRRTSSSGARTSSSTLDVTHSKIIGERSDASAKAESVLRTVLKRLG